MLIKFEKIKLGGKKSIFPLIICSVPVVFGFTIPFLRMTSWAWFSKNYIAEISVFQLASNTLLIAIIVSVSTVLLSILLGFSSKYFKSKIIYFKF